MMTDSDTVNKKLCVIGDGATGKTSLLHRFKSNVFDEKYEPTIFETESLPCEFNGQKINLSLWDTAGQEHFDKIRVLAYDKTDILLMCFSVDNRSSFTNVKDMWMNEYEKNKGKFINAKILLVGTKSDLRGKKDNSFGPDVTKQEGVQMAKEIKAVCYMETSSKTGEGINELKEEAIKAAMIVKQGNPCYQWTDFHVVLGVVQTGIQFRFDNSKIGLIGTKADQKDEAQKAPLSKAEGD